MSFAYALFLKTLNKILGKKHQTKGIPLNNRQHSLKKYLYIQPNIPLRNILRIQPHDLLKIRNITPTTNLPHPGNSRLNGNPCSVMQLILLQLIRQNRSGTHQTHGPSLCQLRNNFSVQKKNL